MNSVKQFQQSDLLSIERCTSETQVRELMCKQGVDTQSVACLIADVYQFATVRDYTLQQKQKIVNLVIQLLKALPSSHTKEIFSELLNTSVEKLGRRDQSCKCSFNLVQVASIGEFLSQKILPYYELYEIVLNNNPNFMLQARTQTLVKTMCEKKLASGTSVEVENVEVLKEFIGIRAAKQQKKDAKKK